MGYITVITVFWILAYAMNIACLSRKTVFNSLYKLIISTKTKRQTRQQFHNMLKPLKLFRFFPPGSKLILSHVYIFFLNCCGSWANSLNRILGLGVGWLQVDGIHETVRENGFKFHQPQDTNRCRRSCVHNRKQVMTWIQLESGSSCWWKPALHYGRDTLPVFSNMGVGVGGVDRIHLFTAP